MSDFSHLYGPEWNRTKQHYWQTVGRPWRRRRCFWCRRGHVTQPGKVRFWTTDRAPELHHLTYVFGYGDAPLFVLRPMCHTCHHIETTVTRMFFGEGFARRSRWAHAHVTYTVRWVINAIPLTGILVLLFKVGVI